MAEDKKLSRFADKWYRIFSDPQTGEREAEEAFGWDCAQQGLSMDCGNEFQKQYGEQAFYSAAVLDAVLGEVRDCQLLGSAVYSKWRYITHWTRQDLVSPENRRWFILALDRLRVLSGENWAESWEKAAGRENPVLQDIMMKTLQQYQLLHPEDSQQK